MSTEETAKLQKRKQKFLEALEITEKSKKQITEFAENLLSLYNCRIISRQEYEEKLNESLKNRTVEQWLKYYDSYINYYKEQLDICEEKIRKGETKSRRKIVLILIILITMVVIAILISLFFSLQSVNLLKNIVEKISSIIQPSKISKVSVSLDDKEAVLSEESLIQYQAVLGKSVKWEKHFTISKPTDFSLKLPANSENIKLKKIENREEQDLSSFSIEKKLFTGEIEVKVEKGEGEYKIEYETPSPEISELEAEGRAIKKVLIKGPDNVHYKDVLSFTELPREFNKNEIGKLKLYEIKNNQRIETKFIAYDTDENGLLDYIEWLTPELSEAVYEIVIEISKVEHLDENKEFISDIYEQVKALDDIWSEEIPSEHYVRVTFKQKLDNSRDITIYPRVVSGEPKIEVYEFNKTEIIAEFTSLNSNQYNKVLLTNMPEGHSQDVFDLRVIDGSIKIEHIIDPTNVVDYYLIGDGGTANGLKQQLQTSQGAATAKWTTSTDGATIYFVRAAYTTPTTIVNAPITSTFSCNKSGTAPGDNIDMDDLYVYDCGTSSDCSTQDATICSNTGTNTECDNTAPTLRSISCTPSSNRTMDAGDYIGIMLIVQLKKSGVNLWYNSSTYTSRVNFTEATDTTPPTVNLISPTNYQNLSSSSVNFNCTMSDTGGLKNSTLYGNWTGSWHANETQTISGTSNSTNFTKTISDGTYKWNCLVCDASNNCGFNNTNWTFSVDTIAPNVAIVYPTNNTNSSNTGLNVNYTVSDNGGTGVQACWYSNDTFSANTTLNNCVNITTVTWAEGQHNVTVWANDTVGNVNSSSVRFTIDTTPPIITIVSPLSQNYTTTTINFNVSINQVGSWCGFSLDGTANITMTQFNDTYFNYTNSTMSQGSHNVVFACNDTLGNMNSSSGIRAFGVDSTPPLVTITSPLNQTYTTSSINFNFSLSEPGYCEYTLNNGLTNYTMTANSSNTGFNATNTSIADGSYTTYAYCNDTAGNKNHTEKITFSVNTNQPPQITYVSEISPVTPIEASSTTITFYATVYDSNGVGDINDSSVKANFTKSGVVRENNCIWLNNIDLNSANYSCSIDLWYFDEAETWNVSVYAQDNSSASAQNISTTFQYSLLKAIVISPSEIIWPEIIQGAKNQTTNTPTIINNTGNFNATGRIAVQAMNLHGETDNSEFIDAGNFTVSIDSGEDSCNGFSLINGTNITITNVVLEAGNLSAGKAQEQLYYCLREVPSVSSQAYSTQQAGSWAITVLIAVFIIKKKKQKSKKLKNNLKEDNLIISLNLLTKELKQDYSEEKEKIIKLLIKEIKKRYKLNNNKIAELIEMRKEIKIPLTIFSKELGALEVITKYAKENLGMNYKEISEVLSRNERTIWTAYNKAKEKQKTPLEIKEKDTFLPISIFNKKLTILESIIVYLKDKKLRYVEIAKLLNRNQRNIWTIYSRAVKKIKGNCLLL